VRELVNKLESDCQTYRQYIRSSSTVAPERIWK